MARRASKSKKSSRHPKIAGDFGEYFILYWLSKMGFETAQVDHTGIDLVAYNKKKKERIGISIKTRTRTNDNENEQITFDINAQKKIETACKAFGCDEGYFGIVVDQDKEKKIIIILLPLSKAIEINSRRRTKNINIHVTGEYLKEYINAPNSLFVEMKYSCLNTSIY